MEMNGSWARLDLVVSEILSKLHLVDHPNDDYLHRRYPWLMGPLRASRLPALSVSHPSGWRAFTEDFQLKCGVFCRRHQTGFIPGGVVDGRSFEIGRAHV